MRTSLVLITSASVFTAVPAFADCTNTLYVKAASGYILKDVGLTSSTEPVAVGEYTHTCDKLSYDLLLSGGPAGKTANELDASIYYDTMLKRFKIQLSAQYYALNLNHSLAKSSDDVVELYADVSLPFKQGKITLAPVVRVIEMIGIKTIPSLALVQPGGRVSIPVTARITFDGDVRYSINLSQHYATIRSSFTASYRLNDRVSINVGWEDTDRTGSVVSTGVRFRL